MFTEIEAAAGRMKNHRRYSGRGDVIGNICRRKKDLFRDGGYQ